MCLTPHAQKAAEMNFRLYELLLDIQVRIISLEAKVDKMTSQQDDIAAEAVVIENTETDLVSASANIAAEIAALKAGNPALDLSALDAAVAQLPAAQASVDALETPPAG